MLYFHNKFSSDPNLHNFVVILLLLVQLILAPIKHHRRPSDLTEHVPKRQIIVHVAPPIDRYRTRDLFQLVPAVEARR